MFYKHMGHAPESNSVVYHCLLAVIEITHVWRYLNDIDGQRSRARNLNHQLKSKHMEEEVSSALSLPTAQKIKMSEMQNTGTLFYNKRVLKYNTDAPIQREETKDPMQWSFV